MRLNKKRILEAGIVIVCAICIIIISCFSPIIIDNPNVPLGGNEKRAMYYINNRNLDYNGIDYRKCYYVGWGTVRIEEVEVLKQGSVVKNPTFMAENSGDFQVTENKVLINENVQTSEPTTDSTNVEPASTDNEQDVSQDISDNVENYETEDNVSSEAVSGEVSNGSFSQEGQETSDTEITEDTIDTEENEVIEDTTDTEENEEIEDTIDIEEIEVEEEKEIIEIPHVGQPPEYNGSLGKGTINWVHIEFIDGQYRVFGELVPAENSKTEEMGLYYLNIKNLPLDGIDYRKCFYLGRGTVLEETDYKDNFVGVETGTVPEYNGEYGKSAISWEKIEKIDGRYRVFGELVPEANAQVEKQAFYYLNIKNLPHSEIDYKKCFYVGRGTIFEEQDSNGGVQGLTTGVIPEYKGEYDTDAISWSYIAIVAGNYRVFGDIETTSTALSSIGDLKSANLKVGDEVQTTGFYKDGDGGGARYKIAASSPYPSGDNRAISLNNGLYAVLVIENNTIIANQLGAYGDGAHDDVQVLQFIVDKGYNLELCSGQIYKLVSNGLYLSNSVGIIGNNATLLVDDSYAPSDKDFAYYMIRNIHGKKLDSFFFKDLNCKVLFSNGRIAGREYNVISPLNIKNLNFEGVIVETSETNNCINCVWINNGCDAVVINNCKFINSTHGATGGALWMTTKADKLFNNEFKSLKNCSISNTYMYSSSADEVFGVWGTYDVNYSVNNCRIEGNIKAEGRTRIISICSQGDNNATFNASFNNSTIVANCDKNGTSSFYDSFLGIGTDYSSNKINATFNNCTIQGSVYGSLIFTSGYRNQYVTRFDENQRPVDINFTKCKIDIDATITGTAMNYYNTAALYPNHAWDCRFDECDISCGKAFAYLYLPGNMYYYVPRIEINNSKVMVKDAKDFIYQAYSNAGVYLIVNNTSINAGGVTNVVTVKNALRGTVVKQNNAIEKNELSNVTLNGKKIN